MPIAVRFFFAFVLGALLGIAGTTAVVEGADIRVEREPRALASLEVLDAAGKGWQSGGELPAGVTAPAVLPLGDGALIVGNEAGGERATAWRDGTLTDLAPLPIDGRCLTVAPLAADKWALFSGSAGWSGEHGKAARFDAATRAWSPLPLDQDLPVRAVVALDDTRLLVIHDDRTAIWDRAHDTWQSATDAAFQSTTPDCEDRQLAIALDDQRLLVLRRWPRTDWPQNPFDVRLLSLTERKLTALATLEQQLLKIRSGGEEGFLAVARRDDRIELIGLYGEYRLTLTLDRIDAVPLPSGHRVSAVTRQGEDWIAVGVDSKAAFRFDERARAWRRLPDLASARTRPAVVTLADGRVLVAGGEVDVAQLHGRPLALGLAGIVALAAIVALVLLARRRRAVYAVGALGLVLGTLGLCLAYAIALGGALRG